MTHTLVLSATGMFNDQAAADAVKAEFAKAVDAIRKAGHKIEVNAHIAVSTKTVEKL